MTIYFKMNKIVINKRQLTIFVCGTRYSNQYRVLVICSREKGSLERINEIGSIRQHVKINKG